MKLATELELLELRDGAGRMTVAKPDMLRLAIQIAEVTQRIWPSYVGAPARFSRKHIPVLYKAALLATEQGLSAEAFVTQQIAGMARLSKFWLSSLASPVYSNDTLNADELKLLQLRSYKAQLALFSSRCMLYGPLLAIRDQANEFSALFRFVLATEYKLPEIAERYRQAAIDEWHSSTAAQDLFTNPNVRQSLQQGAPQYPASADVEKRSDSQSNA